MRLDRTDGGIAVSVEDDGVGMAPAAGGSEPDQAIGLRLIEALTRQVAGRSGYETVAGGTRFTLEVPLAKIAVAT